ncbi:MAG: hypothetical protein MJ138_07970, partial [Kiritimatiellae bacterium]|nr:hypothetical protein [Kiritimatiellia bacterium]
MAVKGEYGRYAFVCVCLTVLVAAIGWRLASVHLGRATLEVSNHTDFSRPLQALRGTIYSRGASDRLRGYVYAASVPVWEYHADPASVVLKRHSRETVVSNVAAALERPVADVRNAFSNWRSRYVPLGTSSSDDAHRVMSNPKLVTGVSIEEKQVRRYPQGRHLAHVLGFVTKDPTNALGAAGVEMRYEDSLRGLPGIIRGEKNALGREILEKRIVRKDPETGCSVHLTINHNVQCDVERELYAGFTNCHARAAWAIVLEADTGAVLAMASLPDFDPEEFNKADSLARKNRAVGENLEPGSVMKTITACAA